ncbi:MAG: hypothetical protein QY326_06660 [Bdellovibrionota bacterium]|nr:MAG: hypothetical protein QY326_06660 [Bdellovibrionota bacterium]
MFVVWRVLLLLAWSLLSGCGWLGSSPRPANGSQPMLPFQLTILDDHFDGNYLAIEADLVARSQWDANKVVLQLRQLRGGEELSRKHYILSKLVAAESVKRIGSVVVVPADSTHRIALSEPSQGATDYELTILWGDEARSALLHDPNRPLLAFEGLKVTRVVHGCEFDSLCPVEFVVEGQLINQSNAPIDQALVTVSWEVPVAFKDTFSHNQVENTIEGLGLYPSDERTVRFSLAGRFPRIITEQVMPVVKAEPLIR